jgi:hypothetical protein
VTDPDEALSRYLVRRVAAAEGRGECPDANLLAGFAEGALATAEEERVGEHLAGCPACREASAEAQAAVGFEARPAARRRPVLWVVSAAAAGLLLAVGGAALLLRERGSRPLTDTATRLVAAASDLARDRPDLFGGFRPLDPQERPPGAGDPERGGARLVAPSGVVLSTRPAFRWAGAPGVTRYEVSLEGRDGTTLWTRAAEGTELAYPSDASELARGTTYDWSLAFEGLVGGRTESRRAFAVATPEEARAFEEASHAVEARVAPDLRDLLLAQVALRRGLVAEAERLARAHLARHPSDEVGRATLRHVRLLQGLSPEPPLAGPEGR